MNPIQTSLVHKILPPRKKTPGKSPTLLLLHGRGANEEDLIGLSEYLDERLFIVSARAPFEFQFGGGYTWYELLEIGRPEPKMFAESYRKLLQFLEDIRKGYPVDDSRLFSLGFSMGTIMSYAVALTHPEMLSGVLVNSGYIPEDTDLTLNWPGVTNRPFFIAHGRHDPVIPVLLGRRARMLLEQAQANVWYREYEMAHQISEESLSDMIPWLARRL